MINLRHVYTDILCRNIRHGRNIPYKYSAEIFGRNIRYKYSAEIFGMKFYYEATYSKYYLKYLYRILYNLQASNKDKNTGTKRKINSQGPSSKKIKI